MGTSPRTCDTTILPTHRLACPQDSLSCFRTLPTSCTNARATKDRFPTLTSESGAARAVVTTNVGVHYRASNLVMYLEQGAWMFRKLSSNT